MQKRYEGSDRQVRGLILRELRASETAVPGVVIAALWTDAVQRERALAGLLRDGLAAGDPKRGYALPGRLSCIGWPSAVDAPAPDRGGRARRTRRQAGRPPG